MKNYLTIIRKIDFVDLFKYGYFRVSNVVPFNGNINDYVSDDNLFDELTRNINHYEYSFEYLMLHFKSNDEYRYDIDVRNVLRVYTFDEDAKREMSISFDPRIELFVSPWTNKFDKLFQKMQIKQSLRGIDNLWTIFDLPSQDIDICREIVSEETVTEVFRDLYANKYPEGDLSIWTYLLRYERHSFYPKDMRGFFCDFIHVYCNYLGKKELMGDVAEETELYKQILNCDPSSKMAMILEVVKKSPLDYQVNKIAKCRFSIVAPLFLFLKSSFSGGLIQTPEKDAVDYIKSFGIESSIVFYLLGISLGYDKTYDAFYEVANLEFFKKPRNASLLKSVNNISQPMGPKSYVADSYINKINSYEFSETTHSESHTYIEDRSTNKLNQLLTQKTLFGEDVIDEPSPKDQPIKWCRKRIEKGKNDVKPIFHQEEKIPIGYQEIKSFSENDKESIEALGFDFEFEKERFSKIK